MKKFFIFCILCVSLFLNSKLHAQTQIDFHLTEILWSKDGQMLISAHGSTLAFWNPEGAMIDALAISDSVSGDRLSISSLAISPDNSYLAIGGTPYDPIGLVFLMDLETKQIVGELESENYIQDMIWSSNGEFLAVASPNTDGFAGEDAVIFWYTNGYIEMSKINGELIEGVSELALSPDNTQIAVTTSLLEDVLIYEIGSGNLLIRLSSNMGRIDSISWSNDGEYIIVSTSALVEPIYSLIIWETSTWTILREIQLSQSLDDVVWNPAYPLFAGKRILEDEVVIFDIEGNEVASFPAWYAFSWSPDGTKIVTGDASDYSKLYVYDVCTNEEPSEQLMACPEPMDLQN